MSSVIATDTEAETFLNVLEQICGQQRIICKQLDELLLLMNMPSENVLEVLRKLLHPLARDTGLVTLSVLQLAMSQAAGQAKEG